MLKLTGEALAALKSSPLALALVCVNLAFLVFAGYVLGEIAESSRDRNKAQIELIERLVKECKT